MSVKVLVVEDEADLREALCAILNLEGFSAHGVGSIAEYRAWRKSNSCDLLVLDRILPDGDGLDLLKEHRQTALTPTTIITCEGKTSDKIAGMSADADYYLVKPIVTEELIAILRRLSRRVTSDLRTQPTWVLDTIRWQLKSPSGSSVPLTRSELNLLSNFVEKSGITIDRDTIIQTLGYNPTHYDLRRLEILVRRLRAKVEKSGVAAFPLSTIYGVGYAFNFPICGT
jgi:DNA-binding response OmpR family regulator